MRRLETRRKTMYKLSYQDIKQRLTAETALAALNIKDVKQEGRQLRAPCKACGGDPRSLSINIDKRSFKCWSAGVGGSLIDLAEHTLGCNFHDAAEHLAEFIGDRAEPSRQPRATGTPDKGRSEA